jgi:hypothetical protein
MDREPCVYAGYRCTNSLKFLHFNQYFAAVFQFPSFETAHEAYFGGIMSNRKPARSEPDEPARTDEGCRILGGRYFSSMSGTR